VPFCRVRCPYCDFATRPDRPSEWPRFVAGVAAEAAARAFAGGHGPDGRPWGSLAFGGGTPSRLDPAAFTRLAAALDRALVFARGHERSLEANPEDLDAARLAAWRAAGVTRLSIGAQSLFDDELHRLGRTHDARAVAEGVGRARAAGFRTLNLDLMYAFPGHTEARWRATLERALALGTDHLSAYAFTPEPGTVTGEAVLAGRVARPDPDGEAALFALAGERIAAAGFRHYEISNFARVGHECRHNLRYWRCADWLGLGPAAHSFVDGRRFRHLPDLEGWTRDPLAVEELPADPSAERVFLGLRLDEGIEPRLLEEAGIAPEETRRRLERLADFVELRDGRLRLTPEGYLLSNPVLAELLR
jgi:oxygen-independent coproporphyrinogen-3 oxidase